MLVKKKGQKSLNICKQEKHTYSKLSKKIPFAILNKITIQCLNPNTKKIEKENFQNTYLYSGVNNIPNIKKKEFSYLLSVTFFY